MLEICPMTLKEADDFAATASGGTSHENVKDEMKGEAT